MAVPPRPHLNQAHSFLDRRNKVGEGRAKQRHRSSEAIQAAVRCAGTHIVRFASFARRPVKPILARIAHPRVCRTRGTPRHGGDPQVAAIATLAIAREALPTDALAVCCTSSAGRPLTLATRGRVGRVAWRAIVATCKGAPNRQGFRDRTPPSPGS